MSSLWSVLLVCALVLGSQDTWAKRVGGGQSVGQASSGVAQRSGVAPAPQAAPTAQAATRPASAAAAATTQRPWGSMLGGLAAGLGLTWLASSLGFGEGLAQLLLLALLDRKSVV